jgi:hypothetical protein
MAAGIEAPNGLLVDQPVLGRKIRGGPWRDQGISTYQKIRDAVADARWRDASELGEYFVTEAAVCFNLYRAWIVGLHDYLATRGTLPDELDAIEERIVTAVALPNGTRFDPGALWAQLNAEVGDFLRAAADADTSAALVILDQFVETWRRCHDRDVDHIGGLMNEVTTRYGESEIGPMYEHLLLPWFEARYSQFDVDKHSWEQAQTLNMMVAFEAMRGHLCGPGRRGDIEIEELPDRFVMRFDPCGSGGRMVRGCSVEETPPRMEHPYEWPVTQVPAPWNHGKPGVCTYCSHCIVLTEIMTIDAFGYPVRAVDPPRYGERDTATPAKCSWSMFKDPSAIPDEYYVRVGRTKPERVGSKACGGAPKPIRINEDRPTKSGQ